jgi:hypothetical protein
LEHIGQCCICGLKETKLSFEHVPPRAAYNDQRVFEASIQGLITGNWNGQERPVQGRWVQRGAGRYTICEKCNNETGGMYGRAYVSWAKQATELLDRSKGTLSLAYPYRAYPLRVLKQITAMFCSACGPPLQEKFRDIPRFVLDRERRYLPHDLRVFAYLVDPSKSELNRQGPMTGVTLGAKKHVFAEVAFAPLGFILTGDVDPINVDLLDITHFGHSSYHRCETLYLKLPVLSISSPLPGDFRSKEELGKSLNATEAIGRMDLNVLG